MNGRRLLLDTETVEGDSLVCIGRDLMRMEENMCTREAVRYTIAYAVH